MFATVVNLAMIVLNVVMSDIILLSDFLFASKFFSYLIFYILLIIFLATYIPVAAACARPLVTPAPSPIANIF